MNLPHKRLVSKLMATSTIFGNYTTKEDARECAGKRQTISPALRSQIYSNRFEFINSAMAKIMFHRCPLVCMFVCLLTTLRKNDWTDFMKFWG